MSEREGREGRPQHRALTGQNNAQSKEQSRPRSERRRDSDRRVTDRRQDIGRDIAASVLEPESSQTRTAPTETTTVFDVENAPRLLKSALIESSSFFRERITVLEVPDAFYRTEERLREIGFTRMEPLVLPQWTLLENDPLWEGKVKPTELFWRFIRYGRLKPELAILQKGASLIDGRPKPVIHDIEPRYEDDEFMGGLIKELRKKGKVQRNSFVRPIPVLKSLLGRLKK